MSETCKECCVCYCKLNVRIERKLACKHEVCKDCIRKWKHSSDENNTTCPYCRSNLYEMFDRQYCKVIQFNIKDMCKVNLITSKVDPTIRKVNIELSTDYHNNQKFMIKVKKHILNNLSFTDPASIESYIINSFRTQRKPTTSCNKHVSIQVLRNFMQNSEYARNAFETSRQQIQQMVGDEFVITTENIIAAIEELIINNRRQ